MSPKDVLDLSKNEEWLRSTGMTKPIPDYVLFQALIPQPCRVWETADEST
jgi:hypothetical protein